MGYVIQGGVDLDGDGHGDVVFGNSMGYYGLQIVAAPGTTESPTRQKKWPSFDGALWHPTWPADGASTGASLAAFDDVDGDGTVDILVGRSDWFWHGDVDRTGTLRLLSGRTGKEIWTVTEQRYAEFGALVGEPK